MAHIHLEDGSFYLQWVIIWTIVALVIIGICVYWLRNVRKMDSRLMTLAALCTAAAFAVFQIEIPVFGGVHLSLTPLIGILAGPAVGGVIVLIVNVFSAALGHGGWGIIGANAIVNMAEIVGAFFIYTWLTRSMKMRALYSAGIATFLGLFLGNAVMIGIILISGIQGKEVVMAELSLVAAANIVMAVIEAFVTAYIVAYIQKVRPDMLGVTRVADKR